MPGGSNYIGIARGTAIAANVTRTEQSTAPYTESEASGTLIGYVDRTNNGASPSSIPSGPASITSTAYNSIIQSLSQEGTFVSSADKQTYSVSYHNPKDSNPIKEAESDVGNTYDLASNISAPYKDSNVKKDGDPTIAWSDPRNYEEGATAPADTDSWLSKWTSKVQVWGEQSSASSSTVHGDTSSKKESRYPYLLIRESRTGTAAYTKISAGAQFSNDIVEIPVLQNVDNFDISTTQIFDNVEPRGSVMPMRFYQKVPGRSLNFTAKFHQQEYPLEPLLSIEAKAHYLCLPYKHSDFSEIPKLVEVFVPGRVYRGYMTQASANYSGDDYRNWSDMDIQGNAGSFHETDGFYGGYQARELSPRGGTANGKDWLSTEEIYYGLSTLSITFSLAIVEEIRLTTYQSASDLAAATAAAELDTIEARKQYILEQTRLEVAADKDPEDTTPIDDCILVDDNGWVIGVEYINKDGQPVSKVPASVTNIRYSDDGSITPGTSGVSYSYYLKQKELKGSLSQQGATGYVAPIDELSKEMLAGPTTKDDMVAKLVEWKKEASPEYTDEMLAQYRKGLEETPFDEVYEQYKQEFKEKNPSLANKILIEYLSYKTLNGTMETKIDPLLEKFLSLPITTLDEAKAFIASVGHLSFIIYQSSPIIDTTLKVGINLFTQGLYNMVPSLNTWPKTPDSVTEYAFSSESLHYYLLGKYGFYTKGWNVGDVHKKWLEQHDIYGFLSFHDILDLDESSLRVPIDSKGNQLKEPDKQMLNYVVSGIRCMRDGAYRALNNWLTYYKNKYPECTVVPLRGSDLPSKGDFLGWYVYEGGK